MSSHSAISSSPFRTSTSNPNATGNTSMLYFNETGPVYRTEHVQAKEFVEFVRAHVVLVTSAKMNGSIGPGKETAWFDWEAFRAAVASQRASGISPEHDLTAIIPPYTDTTSIPPAPTTATSSDVPDTTIQAVLDALVARFASTFTNVLFVPTTTADWDTTGGEENPRAHFFDTLQRNLYYAFTHHLEASDAPERCLSFHRRTHSDADARARSAWEYRLLFVHSDVQSRAVRGLVMTVTLEGSFEEDGEGEGEERWYGISLDSTGPFSGVLRAMQVVVGEGFRCP